MPVITAITLVYNGMPYLKEAVESVLTQSFTDFEYIIVDDCSSDDSYKYLLTLKDPRIRLFRNECNLGVSRSFNYALKKVLTDYIFRLDQDDICYQNRFRNQLDFMIDKPSVSVSSTWEYLIDTDSRRYGRAISQVRSYPAFLVPILLGLTPIWHPSLCIKTDVLREVNGFDPSFPRAEDFDLTSRLALNRYQAAIVPEFLLGFRSHPKQQSQAFNVRMREMTLKIHINSLTSICPSIESDSLLIRFLRRTLPPSLLIKGNVFHSLSLQFSELFISANHSMKLTNGEKFLFMYHICRLLGFGCLLLLRPSLCKLKLLSLVFLLVSPQYIIKYYKNYKLKSLYPTN